LSTLYTPQKTPLFVHSSQKLIYTHHKKRAIAATFTKTSPKLYNVACIVTIHLFCQFYWKAWNPCCVCFVALSINFFIVLPMRKPTLSIHKSLQKTSMYQCIYKKFVSMNPSPALYCSTPVHSTFSLYIPRLIYGIPIDEPTIKSRLRTRMRSLRIMLRQDQRSSAAYQGKIRRGHHWSKITAALTGGQAIARATATPQTFAMPCHTSSYVSMPHCPV
jgi:hypothetical protein